MSDYRGMNGDIEVGTLIAMPFAKHSTGYVRVGRVTELVPEKQTQYSGMSAKKIRVEWLLHKEYRPPKQSLVENFFRALVLPSDFPV
jgi:hypothetical protein